ncbi:uncharacterized protein LOC143193632 [Rhynchophorus ferrugineus]|uniref:uncharacterized protein LOC143193632 n=1 Tax=Rhynchophorus ferrugineus TaxID=354439 RepID=UPI003FCE601E
MSKVEKDSKVSTDTKVSKVKKRFKTKSKAKAKPKPKKPNIQYPPVPTKKWIPPDKRKKRHKMAPKYVKPEGITQKLTISTLKKVWHKFDLYDGVGILTGHFSQYHKRFTFKSNGYQGACNSAVACVYSSLYKMPTWTSYLIDEIIIKGDELYIRSTQQGDKCLIEVPPDKIYTSFFLRNDKITLFVNSNVKQMAELTSANEEKAKELITNVVDSFLDKNDSAIFYINEKYAAIWKKDGVFYYFDPGDHDDNGNPWMGVPGAGVSFVGRFKKTSLLVNYLYINFPDAKKPYSKIHLVPCGVARITKVKTSPPEKFEDVMPKDQTKIDIIEKDLPIPPNPKLEALKNYVKEDKDSIDPQITRIQEISPMITNEFPPSRRPSFIRDGTFNKEDVCRYSMPVPSYLKGEQAKLTYYTDVPDMKMEIIRGNTAQTIPTFSKYVGRQSMGNAMSALIMLRLCKSKHWTPSIVNNLLEYGDRLFKEAMSNIPRTHSLRLSNFSRKTEYEKKLFMPEIDEYAIIGQMQSQEFTLLDLEPALNEILADYDCCVLLGPQVLAVWLEDGYYYMFDPNERDQNGKVLVQNKTITTNIINLDLPRGVACVTRFKNLKDLVNLYVSNTEKSKRSSRFYLSKVLVKDYEEIPDEWYNFQGVALGKWILRGTFNQASSRFSDESRNLQGPATAVMALAIQLMFDPQEWSSDTVDEILMAGDKIYKSSTKTLQDKSLFVNSHLMLSELNKTFKVRTKEATLEIEECVINGLISANKENDTYDLKNAIETFFIDNDMGILTTRDISIALWLRKGAYFYLDPYSRDSKGLAAGYGTSCAMRFLTIQDLVHMIETNLDPNLDDYFNITKVKLTLYDALEGGKVIPPLNNYSKLKKNSAILRSWVSEKNEKYEIRRGRQTVPMCLSAIGFNKLKPSSEWTRNDMDAILDKGDDLYIKSMSKAQDELIASMNVAQPPPPPEDAQAEATQPGSAQPAPAPQAPTQPVDTKAAGDAPTNRTAVDTTQPAAEAPAATPGLPTQDAVVEEEEEPQVEVKITSDNVITDLNIGPNNLLLEFSDIASGNIKELLKDSIKTMFKDEQTDENFNQEGLLETKNYTVALWRDDKAYYVFDSKPRNSTGQVIGKEDWDPEPIEVKPTDDKKKGKKSKYGEFEDGEEGEERESGPSETEGEEEKREEDKKKEEDKNKEETKGDEDKKKEENKTTEEDKKSEEDEKKEGDKKSEDEKKKEEDKKKEGDKNKEEDKKSDQKRQKKSQSYWVKKEVAGRACVLWFTELDDLITFIYENIQPKDRCKSDFTLKSVKVTNSLKIKSKYNPDDERGDVYAGDWYDFKEIDHGKWILRGSLDLTHNLFPEGNRGKQGLTASIIALAVANIYEITCFASTTPDTIMVYGDKLYTYMKKIRKKQLKEDRRIKLKDDEIDWVMKHEDFKLTDIPKKICLSKFMVEVQVEPNKIVGDVKAQSFEDILDVKRGLDKFFEDSKYGILQSKGIYIAIWKGEKMYYLFDGLKRGPNGIQSTTGSGCIIRCLMCEDLAKIFLENIPNTGRNEFFIHKITMSRNLCPRERAPHEIIPAPKAVPITAGFKVVIPGKSIVRGTISQEDPKFAKGPNIMSAPIAIVALTMAEVHKPENWSKPIVDETIILGSELYEDSISEMGFDFNPYEDRLDIYRVKSNFKLGVLKVSCEFRHTDQKGIIETKDPTVNNLRRGIENFFEENTHGILVTEPLTLAIWEAKPTNKEKEKDNKEEKHKKKEKDDKIVKDDKKDKDEDDKKEKDDKTNIDDKEEKDDKKEKDGAKEKGDEKEKQKKGSNEKDNEKNNTLGKDTAKVDENPSVFVFDPNPRSSTGMPLLNGTGCLMSFVNSKMAADHIIGCILDQTKRGGDFIIVPVEIVINTGKKNRILVERTPTKSSINTLPRCSKLTASEQQKKLRKLAEEERKRKKAKTLQLIGRNGYYVKGNEAILRGYKSQNSAGFCAETRNKQDIPNCIASVVMHSLVSIEDWNYKHIDIILDTGDQLYIDSYIAYGPKDPKLGMENILRKFYWQNLEVHVTVYKPIKTEILTNNRLNGVLETYFQQENFCIFQCVNDYISLFFKGGYYFMFDPHERDMEGNIPKPDKEGTAIVMRFDSIKPLSIKIIQNLCKDTEEEEKTTFTLWLISVDTK